MNSFSARSLTALALVTAALVIPAGARAADDPTAEQPAIHCSGAVPVVDGGAADLAPQDELPVDAEAIPAEAPVTTDDAPEGSGASDPLADDAAGAGAVAELPGTDEVPLVDESSIGEPMPHDEAVYCWAVDVPVYAYDSVSFDDPRRADAPAPQERTVWLTSLPGGTADPAPDLPTSQIVTTTIPETTTVPEQTTTVPQATPSVPETTTTAPQVTTSVPGSTASAPGATPVTGRAHFTG